MVAAPAKVHCQERELERVNAFYLQKEAEVCVVVGLSRVTTYPSAAEATPKDPLGQETNGAS